MAKNMPTKKASGPSFMFPTLHDEVATAVANDVGPTHFHEQDSAVGVKDEYSTNIMGKFICTNKACLAGGWFSNVVTIHMRSYPDNGYNAVVFNQHCKSCNRLGVFKVDKTSYVERVAYRLRRWAGVPVERPHYIEKETMPHKSELCEGCKRGFCRQSRFRTRRQLAQAVV